MKCFAPIFLLGVGLVAAMTGRAANPSAPAAPVSTRARTQTLVLTGPVTNTTMERTATVRLTLAIEGGKVTGTMKTEPPLAGTGRLEGVFRGGWCELKGRLDEGFEIRLCGVFDGRDFRGTYIVAVPGEPLRYGRFQLAQAASP